MKEQENYDLILEEYRSIWNNRLLSKSDEESKVILLDAIKRELLDENSHPRARKNRYEKYYLAVNRVVKSDVTNETKIRLITLHNELMEELSEERK